MFLKNGTKKFRPIPWQKIAKDQHNKDRNAVQQKTRLNRLLKKESKRRATLANAGIEYDFPGYKAALPQKRQRKLLD